MKPKKQHTMRLPDLVSSLEEQQKGLCFTKRTVKSLMSRQGEKMSDKMSKNYNKAIDSIGKMVVEVWEGIEYEVPFTEYSDEAPISKGIPSFRKNYDANSENAVIMGKVNVTLSVLDKMSTLTNVLNPADYNKIELTEEFFSNHRSATEALDDIIEEAQELFVVEESEEDDAVPTEEGSEDVNDGPGEEPADEPTEDDAPPADDEKKSESESGSHSEEEE